MTVAEAPPRTRFITQDNDTRGVRKAQLLGPLPSDSVIDGPLGRE